MTDKEREERRKRNLELLGKTDEQVDDHLQKGKMRELAVEVFKKTQTEGATPPPDLTEEQTAELTGLMDRIIEITGCGSVALILPEHQEMIKHFSASRDEGTVDWVGRALQLLLSVEVISTISDAPRILADANMITNEFTIAPVISEPPEAPAPPPANGIVH